MPHANSAKPISPIDHELEGAGMGKIVRLRHSLSVEEIVSMVKKHLKLEHGTWINLELG